jgi:dolichol-phosphate mannosyltransferase
MPPTTDHWTRWSTRDPQSEVKVINMSRRFGVSECARAGMSASSGDATIIMDADLQDPPEVIPQLLEKWRAGADVVHTVRTRRHGESALKMMMTRLAYRIIHLGSSIELPVDAGDFKLLSRPALNHLLALTESDPYIRGLVVWIGFQQAFVPTNVTRGMRERPLSVLQPQSLENVRDGPDLVFLHADLCGHRAGARASGVTVLLVLYVLLRQLLFGDVSTALVLAAIGAFFWTTTLVAVAAVGIYVIRIYKDIRNRPQYIVASTLGVSMPAEKAAVERVTM